MNAGIVVVGAGQAACQLAASLRQLGYQGPLTLVGAEPHLPYQRPPLSKACLQGAGALPDLLLRPATFYESIQCRLLLGRSVVAVDPGAKTVRLDDGETLAYTQLVLATGAAARDWPGLPQQPGLVYTLRTWDDAQALGRRLDQVRHLAVLGAGYVGLEVAASVRKRGVQVSVFEAAPRVLQRSVGTATSALIESLHRAQGVALHLGVRMESVRVDAAAGHVLLNTSAGGFTADALLVGIGAAPRIALAQQAGLQCGQAIRVDAACRTSDADVFAIGDCAEQVLEPGADPVRLESVPNATEQAKCVAAVLAGKPLPALPVPWFWSDQFGHRIQVAGRSAPGDEIVVRRGLAKPAAQSTWYLRGGRVAAVEAVDAAEDFMAARQWIKAGQRVDPARLADPHTALRDVTAAIA